MTAIVHALYHGVVSIRKVTFPPIQRGFQYTLTLADIGTTTESAIVTEPFTDGGMVDATDDKRLYLYPNNTDGTISGNTLTVTDGSNDEVMSFLAPFGVNLDIVEGNEYVSEVVKEGITKMEDMKLTTYRFRLSDVTPPGGIEKSIKVSVRSNEVDPTLAQEFYLFITCLLVTRRKDEDSCNSYTNGCLEGIISNIHFLYPYCFYIILSR